MPIMIIAEAGINHNGDVNIAKRMIDVAKEAGADIVKFQSGNRVISRFAPKAEYQKVSTGTEESQLDMCKKYVMTSDEFNTLVPYCAEKGIQFLSTPFDLDAIDDLLLKRVPFWKIPSGEVTNLPYLMKIGKTHMPVVMSTGMCEMNEIRAAMEVLRQNGSGEITLLQCNTEYPTPFQDVNLRAMQTMREVFGVQVGYSDHTRGIEVPIAAAALGATVIEKHFTLDRNMEGPDHQASLEPDEFLKMVNGIRHVEAALGTGKKNCMPSEKKNIDVARKSIVANRNISAGEVFTEENLYTLRPGNGISPMRWYEVLGKTAKRDFAEEEMIEL